MATTSTTFVQAAQLAAKMKSAIQADTGGVTAAIKAAVPATMTFRGAFAASTAYAVGDLVTQAGQTYRCNSAHTSSAVLDATKFDLIAAKGNDGAPTGGSGASIKVWAASTAYAAGDVVSNDGQLYKAKAAFTSGTAFDATKWDKLTDKGTSVTLPKATSAWTPSTAYAAGDLCTYNNQLLQAKAAHTSGTGTAPTMANWTVLTAPTMKNAQIAVTVDAAGAWSMTAAEVLEARTAGAKITWWRQKPDGTFVSQPTSAQGRVNADIVQLQSGETVEQIVIPKGVAAFDSLGITGSGIELNGRFVDNKNITPAPTTTLQWSADTSASGSRAQVQPTKGLAMYSAAYASFLPVQPISDFKVTYNLSTIGAGQTGGVIFRSEAGKTKRFVVMIQNNSDGTATVIKSDWSTGSEAKATLGTIATGKLVAGGEVIMQIVGDAITVTAGTQTFTTTLSATAKALGVGFGLFAESYASLEATNVKYEVI